MAINLVIVVSFCAVGAATNGWVAITGRNLRIGTYRNLPPPTPRTRGIYAAVAVGLLASGVGAVVAVAAA